jgi:hypothetical protein
MEQWVPIYSRWRHGGWYVDNVRYPSGAVGCVSRNYPDRKWRIVCANQDEITYATRDAAAHAERALAASQVVPDSGTTKVSTQAEWLAYYVNEGFVRG